MFLFVNDSNSAALGLLLLRFVVGFGFAGAGILVFVRGEARSARGIAEAAAMIVGGILFALGLITVVGTALLVVVTAVRLADIGLTGAGDRAERRLAIVLLTVFVTVTAT